MTRRYYDPISRRLVYVGNAADAGYWDRHWTEFELESLLQDPPLNPHNRMILETTRRFLPEGSRILEGGCGLGDKVALLQKGGFEVVGVDFAAETLTRIKAAAPHLDVHQEDVRALSFQDESFDGYWSLGVIEHFYRGYGEIRDEIFRVLKPGGILFLTFPSLSILRSLKAMLRIYPPWREEEGLIEDFYQFALDPGTVRHDFEAHGFEFRAQRPLSGFKGLGDEIPLLDFPLRALYRLAYLPTEFVAGSFANHATLLVLTKRGHEDSLPA
ncbi:class I SAM-dependent methyltransferase [Gemmatimonadota bacterium]